MPKLINNQRKKRSKQLSDGNIKMLAPISKNNSQNEKPKRERMANNSIPNSKGIALYLKNLQQKKEITIIHQCIEQ